MVVTAVVAIVLGICRAVIGGLTSSEVFEPGPLTIVGLVVVAGIVMMLPLLLAALLPRHAVPASLLVLVLIGLGTATELPLLNTVRPAGAGGGTKAWHFLGINALQALWVLAVAGGLRMGGFSLSARARA
jgi:hypothetical protein